MSLLQFSLSQQYVQESCCSCGCAFALSLDMYNRFKQNSDLWFYCPNGHRQHYSKSEVNRLKEQLELKERILKWARIDRAQAQRQVSAARGQITKIKNRVATGVCPRCKRSFGNLRKHMSHMHPDFKNAESLPKRRNGKYARR